MIRMNDAPRANRVMGNRRAIHVPVLLLVATHTILATFRTDVVAGEGPAQESAHDRSVVSESVDLALSISIKRESGTSVLVQGEPIRIDLQLSNKAAEAFALRHREKAKQQAEDAIRSGKNAEPVRYTLPLEMVVKLPGQGLGWAASVRFQIAGKGDGGKPDEEVWPQRDWRGFLEADRSTSQITDRPASARWCLRPEVTRELAPGRYEIIAHYDTTELEGDRVPRGDLVASAEFDIVGATEENKDARYFLQMSMSSLLRDGNPDDAIRYAKLGIAKDPGYDRHQGYLCLGEAYEWKGMREAAIAAYEEFLKHHPGTPHWDAPNIVRNKVERLKQIVRKDE